MFFNDKLKHENVKVNQLSEFYTLQFEYESSFKHILYNNMILIVW